MSKFYDQYNPKMWESFCEKMIRHHYGVNNFWTVPDYDAGDYGIEYFTATGDLFQCYFPNLDIDIKQYKRKIQKKINDDLNKLEKNKHEIEKILDDIKIRRWILLIPKNLTKELIVYCNKKKNEVIKKNISFIDNANFKVKIETAESYPLSKNYALSVGGYQVNISIDPVNDDEKDTWSNCNIIFSDNIKRKSDVIMNEKSKKFQIKIMEKYIQIEKFLDVIRSDFPDLYQEVNDMSLALLGKCQEKSLFVEKIDSDFIEKILEINTDLFKKFSINFSENNRQLLPFGYISKWFAECNFDLISDDE